MPSTPTSPAPLLLAMLLGACSSGPTAGSGDAPSDPAPHHQHDLAPSVVVEIAPDRPGFVAEQGREQAVPATPVARIPTGSTVFFRNATKDQFLRLAFGGDFKSCGQCASVMNFACQESGAVANAIEPGGVATLCFHEVGRFPFRVTGAGQAMIGIIEVGEPATTPQTAGGQR